MEEEFLIPIDDAIEAFRHHLDARDRTILSARFGDGKSFFLSHFMESVDVAERYTFLTIFPVNYQVTENRDIFELIKRDILLQMLLKGIIETEIEISDEVALALYLQNHPLSFAESFLPLLSELALNEDAAKTVAITLAGKKFFNNIKQKLDKIKEQKQSRDSQLDAFLNVVEQNPVVGQDAISSIIQKCLQQYRDKYPNKRVVLVIEDLDRIDPAHLFRILNIFSAHIDFCYRVGCKPDKTLAGNKFGLDKIIFVMHYENVKNIYNHFYGADTSFEGYIEKFCSSNHFNFSLQEQRDSYIIKQISQETGLPSNVLNYFIKPDDFKDLSVRKVVSAMNNTDISIIYIPTARNREKNIVPLHTGILRLIVILRKLKIKDADIIERIKYALRVKQATSDGVFLYIAQYLTLLSFKNSLANFRYAESMNIYNTVNVEDIDNEGRAVCSYSIFMNEEKSVEMNLQKQLEKLLKFVAK